MPGLLSWVVTVIRDSKYKASDVGLGPGPNIRHPLSVFPSLHRVPRDWFPGFISTMRVLRLPVAQPAALRFLRLAVPRFHSFCSILGGRVRRRGLELVTRYLQPGYRRGDELDLPSSWGISIVRLHMLQSDAGRTARTRPYSAAMRPLVCQQQRLPQLVFRRSIAWLSDSLSTLRSADYSNTTQLGSISSLSVSCGHPQIGRK